MGYAETVRYLAEAEEALRKALSGAQYAKDSEMFHAIHHLKDQILELEKRCFAAGATNPDAI